MRACLPRGMHRVCSACMRHCPSSARPRRVRCQYSAYAPPRHAQVKKAADEASARCDAMLGPQPGCIGSQPGYETVVVAGSRCTGPARFLVTSRSHSDHILVTSWSHPALAASVGARDLLRPRSGLALIPPASLAGATPTPSGWRTRSSSPAWRAARPSRKGRRTQRQCGPR